MVNKIVWHSKRILLLAAIMLPVVAVLLTIPTTAALNVSSVRDCDANAVINCGALSTTELQTKCNASSSARIIFGNFGIGSCDIATLGNVVIGEVTSGDQVFVNGRLVATNAVTAGRQNISGSQTTRVNSVTFFRRPPSVSFASSPLAAFVVMNNGSFSFAVLASCGNPVNATPVAKPVVQTPTPPSPPKTVTKVIKVSVPAPAPSPPAQQQNQSQSQSQTVNVTAPAATTTPTPPPASATATATTPQTQAQSQAVSAPAPSPAPMSTPVAAAPAQLPNTGAGDILGLGALATVVSGGLHYIIRRKYFV